MLSFRFFTSFYIELGTFFSAKEHVKSQGTTGSACESFRPKICNKYRKHWKSLVSFQLSGKTGPILVVLELSTILQCTFDCVFSCFLELNKYKIVVSVHHSIRTKKLIYTRMRKLLAWKCNFWGQNRQFFIGEKEKLPCFLYLIQIFVLGLARNS